MAIRLAKRMSALNASEIRELLKLTQKPGVISFAGGLPAAELFPVHELASVAVQILRDEGMQALQYSTTEGCPLLREAIAERMNAKRHTRVTADELLITSGSQQGLDLTGKLFIDRGDTLLCESPTYLGAINAFKAYGPELVEVSTDDDGIVLAALERRLEQCDRVKLIYVVPDFQNPSGITLGLKRRHQLIELAEKYDLIIIEDSPYRQLRFEGDAPPPLISLNSDRILSIYSFSKILLPGFRLGWMAGPNELIQKMITAKQAVDLCAPPFNQAILAEFMRRGYLEQQIKKIITAYKEKRDFMLLQLKSQMGDIPGLSWTEPEGGLFLWVTLPEGMDSRELFMDAVEQNVAYVMGSSFDPDGMDKRNMRLNFSFASIDEIGTGIQRLAEVIRNRLTRKVVDAPVAP